MSAWRLAPLALLIAATGAQDAGQDWSGTDMGEFGTSFAQSQAICRRVIDAEPPAADLPSAAEEKALKGCDSENLYYGIGVPADPVKARKCAMTEPEYEGFFSGRAMLMMIYANGRGATRNYDVALHMACGMSDAPAAMDGRIKHLEALRAKHATTANFESCDDITSGMSGGLCADHASRLAAQNRARRIAALDRNWPAPQRALFDAAYKRFETYAGTSHEMDCYGGTARDQCAIDGREADVERFLKRIEALAGGRTPVKEPAKDDDGVRPATVDAAGWRAFTHDIVANDLSEYERNRSQAIAERIGFERALIAFSGAAFPKLTPHQVRMLFSDL